LALAATAGDGDENHHETNRDDETGRHLTAASAASVGFPATALARVFGQRGHPSRRWHKSDSGAD
jgi:hypothetical protein